jgi:hypothetical protein
MGIDFLTRIRPTIQRTIDRHRVALATPDLFTRAPADQPRTVLIALEFGATVTVGETLILETRAPKLTARRKNTVVGSSENPSQEIYDDIARNGGVAGGMVKRVLKFSGKVEVTVC